MTKSFIVKISVSHKHLFDQIFFYIKFKIDNHLRYINIFPFAYFIRCFYPLEQQSQSAIKQYQNHQSKITSKLPRQRPNKLQMPLEKYQSIPIGIMKKQSNSIKIDRSKTSISHNNLSRQSSQRKLSKLIKGLDKNVNQNNQETRSCRSNMSRRSSISVSLTLKSHQSKQKTVMSQYYEQKQTEKLVQRLLCLKPSSQVDRKKQKESFKKHTQVKSIMTHKFVGEHEKSSKKQQIIVLKKKQNVKSNVSGNLQKRQLIQKKPRTQDIQQSLKDQKQKDFELLRQKLRNIQIRQIELRNKLKEQIKKKQPYLFPKKSSVIHMKPSLPKKNLQAFQNKHNRHKTLELESALHHHGIQYPILIPVVQIKSQILPPLNQHSNNYNYSNKVQSYERSKSSKRHHTYF